MAIQKHKHKKIFSALWPPLCPYLHCVSAPCINQPSHQQTYLLSPKEQHFPSIEAIPLR